ncbi:hypothetical protein OH491_06390 [Termitidicoccus mucosus]|uniref:Lipoprotein n=1 Tax=Termitidicoccus mucosus TaxID=1184151 RepID=A0A178IDJ0_9BACT|nr:hypothetical protein AW736_18585 [Opitutaceae bacterium TSB47]
MRISLPPAGLLIFLPPVLFVAACVSDSGAPPTDVTVAAERSKAAPNFEPPTAEAPAYYAFRSIGGVELGAIYAGEQIPPRDEVEPLVEKALAGRHYLKAGKGTPPPSLVIAYAWGSINAEDGDRRTRERMLSLVTTNKMNLEEGSVDLARNPPNLDDGRYFLVVAAFDRAELKAGRKKMLWRSKLSTGSAGTTLTEMLPSFLNAGADFFGQDGLPAVLDGKLKEGVVTIGDAEVVPDKAKSGQAEDRRPPAVPKNASQPGPTED